jgi:hypothetical protein
VGALLLADNVRNLRGLSIPLIVFGADGRCPFQPSRRGSGRAFFVGPAAIWDLRLHHPFVCM